MYDPIAERYAQAAFESAKADGRVEEALEELLLIGWLLQDQPGLSAFLLNPGVDPDEKVAALDRALQGAWSWLVRALVHLVVSLGRAEFLAEIVEAFQAKADQDAGLLRVLVRSTRPLPEPVLNRLRGALERRERKRIDLRAEIDPVLIGGLQVRLDHRVIDGSVERQLVDLRQRLKSVRVH